MIDDFEDRLALVLGEELAEWQARLADETMLAFDVGCFPWHGNIELSFLTTSEPRLGMRPPFGSIAEWRLYNFVPNWPRARDLTSAMKNDWTLSSDKKDVADRYFRACAKAACSTVVSAVLSRYRRGTAFEVRVLDPDAPKGPNYCCVHGQ